MGPPLAAHAAATSQEAWTLVLRGEHEAAAARAREALAGADPARAAICLVEACRRLGRDEEALRIVDAFAAAHPGTPVAELARGRLARLRREPEAAEEALRRALPAAIAAGDSLAKLVTLEQLANLYQDVGRFAEASEHHARALDLAALAGDSLVLISANYGLGYCAVAAGRHAEAERLTQSALAGAARLDLPLWVGDAEALLAVLRWIGQDLDGTYEGYRRAAEAYERAGDAARAASCLRKMAATDRTRGEVPRAIEGLRRARALALDAGSAGEAAFALEHLGSIASDLGDFPRARAQWESALREGAATWPPEWRSAALQNIGSLLIEEERHGEALPYLEGALAVLTESESRLAVPGALARLARCLRALGRVEEAVSRLDEAIATAQANGLTAAEAEASVDLALCQVDRNRLDEAERLCNQAARLSAGHGLLDLEPRLRHAQGLVARRQGRLEESLRHHQAALDLVEGVRARSRESTAVQQGVFAGRRRLYEDAVDLLHELHRARPAGGYDLAAFGIAQRCKARSFADLLAEARVRLRVRADTAYVRREGAILARIAELDAAADASSAEARGASEEIDRLEDELAILERKIRAADPRSAAIRYPRPARLEVIQAEGLGPGELLLEYLVGEEASYAWAVTRNSCRFFRIPSRTVLRARAGELLPLLADYNLLGPEPAYFLPPAQALSDALLRPALEEIRRSASVRIAPDDVLHFLPFEALFCGMAPPDARAFSTLPFLVTVADVSYIACGSLLAGFAGGPATRGFEKELLLVGDPELPRGEESRVFLASAANEGSLSPAGIAEEMRALREVVGNERTVTLSGPRSTRREVRLAGARGRHRFVHFASHGVYNERRPRFSGLVLAPDPVEGDDGFLTIDEVMALDLPCDQVVLSACFSALGEHVQGEGIIGLARALHYAGARRVVADLWAVSGWATARFMRAFYERLAADPAVSGAHALAETKRWMIRQPPWSLARDQIADPAHPCFWAPFVSYAAGRE